MTVRYIVLILVASAGVARADFANSGTRVIEARSNFRAGVNSTDDSVVGLDIGGACFVADNISLGARVRLAYEGGGANDTTAGVGVHAGFVKSIGERALVWPQAGAALTRSSFAERFVEVVGGLQAQVPFYVQPVEHLLIGGGPVFTADLFHRAYDRGVLGESSDRFVFELVGSVAGWW